MSDDRPAHGTGPPVGDNHRRTITSALLLVEAFVDLVEHWAGGALADSVLSRETNSLSPDQRQRLLAEAAAIRELLRAARDDLHLPIGECDAVRQLWAHGNVTRDYIADLGSRQLRKYGRPHADLAAYMDRLSARLRERVDAVLAALSSD